MFTRANLVRVRYGLILFRTKTSCVNTTSAGRLVGLIPKIFHSMVYTILMGLVPKGHKSDRWWLIVDLSSPRWAIMNDSISKDIAALIAVGFARWCFMANFPLQTWMSAHEDRPQGCLPYHSSVSQWPAFVGSLIGWSSLHEPVIAVRHTISS